MARLRKGQKVAKARQVRNVVRGHDWGLRESEIAGELGWQRRTVNNYLRSLQRQGQAYKEGRSWFVDE
jgi:DNA-binding IclR family transcriptional regulator